MQEQKQKSSGIPKEQTDKKQTSEASLQKGKKKTADWRLIFKWCRHAELNHELILTMDVYYHYTMPALVQRLIILPVYKS